MISKILRLTFNPILPGLFLHMILPGGGGGIFAYPINKLFGTLQSYAFYAS